jgi:hypothetical protein
MGKINVANMMNMSSCVRFHILMTLGLGEDKTWEYNPSDRILIVHLHKVLIHVGYDNKEQMSNIFMHIHFRVINHIIIHAYVESCTRNGYVQHEWV